MLQQSTNDITLSNSLHSTHECLEATGQNSHNRLERVNNEWSYSVLSYLLSNLTANTTDYAEKLHKIKRRKSYWQNIYDNVHCWMQSDKLSQQKTPRDWISAANISQQKLNKWKQTLSPCSFLLQALLLLLYFIVYLTNLVLEYRYCEK